MSRTIYLCTQPTQFVPLRPRSSPLPHLALLLTPFLSIEMLATILTFLVVSVITLGAPLTSVPPPTTSLLEPSSLSSLAANITGNPQFDSIVVFGDQCSDNGSVSSPDFRIRDDSHFLFSSSTGSYVATEHKWPSDRRVRHSQVIVSSGIDD